MINLDNKLFDENITLRTLREKHSRNEHDLEHLELMMNQHTKQIKKLSREFNKKELENLCLERDIKQLLNSTYGNDKND